MSWQPTIGTLSATELGDLYEVIYRCRDCYGGESTVQAMTAIETHVDALTAQLERARTIAVSLEQELAQRGAGTWPMRQYATVELPDEAVDKAGVE